MTKQRPSKEELQRKYNKLGSTIKVGKYHKISVSTAWQWMKDAGIKTWKKPSKEELEAKCKEFGYNPRKIGEFYKVTPAAAWNWMKDYGIKTNKSNLQISQEKKPSKEELEAKCKELEYNATKVGGHYKVTEPTALKWMKDEGIKIKSYNKHSLEKAVQEYIEK